MSGAAGQSLMKPLLESSRRGEPHKVSPTLKERRRRHLQDVPLDTRRSAMAEAATKLPVKKSATAPEPAEWRPLEDLRREVNRLFYEFGPSSWRLPSRVFGLEVPRVAQPGWELAPAIDLVEKDDSYEISAELPGIDEKNIEIKLANHTLTIKGEKSDEKEEKRKDYYLSERRFGSFQRSFQLPEGVDTNKIEATFAKGVLKVTLPKSAEAKNAEKTIAVKAA
jgi:HSP20 family protein